MSDELKVGDKLTIDGKEYELVDVLGAGEDRTLVVDPPLSDDDQDDDIGAGAHTPPEEYDDTE